MGFPWSLPDRSRPASLAAVALGALLLAGCRAVAPGVLAPAPSVVRTDDEIIVAGQRFHTGTRVVAWMDPGGYNAYQGALPVSQRPAAQDRTKAGGSRLAALQEVVDQFVLHYDACGLSKICFNALQERGLSVHFLLDVDGTVYQTLDLQERAAHATTANDRSIDIELANIGAFPPGEAVQLEAWYQRDAKGEVRLRAPARIRDPGIRTKNFAGRPARPEQIRGQLQGQRLVQYDYTPEQYDALAKLTAALCRVFPRLKCDYPHDAAGRLITRKLPEKELENYRGLLGHFHVQENKTDPGPALQWRKIVEDARRQMK